MVILRQFLARSLSRQGAALLFTAIVVLGSTVGSNAAPLEYFTRVSVNTEGYICRIDGRMGLGQEIGGIGTLNDFRTDLGLPADQWALRLCTAIRPLQHHELRLYGSIPESYEGGRILDRDLVTPNNRYPAGTEIESEMAYASFGFGYDLDFLIGPRYYTGLHGDLKYLHSMVRFRDAAGLGLEDVIYVDELLPCLGVHVEAMFPAIGNIFRGPLRPGGFARMTYGISPNYLNYVDVSIGLTADIAGAWGRRLHVRVGFEHETFFHQQEFFSGKALEFKRNGVLISVTGTF